MVTDVNILQFQTWEILIELLVTASSPAQLLQAFGRKKRSCGRHICSFYHLSIFLTIIRHLSLTPLLYLSPLFPFPSHLKFKNERTDKTVRIYILYIFISIIYIIYIHIYPYNIYLSIYIFIHTYACIQSERKILNLSCCIRHLIY